MISEKENLLIMKNALPDVNIIYLNTNDHNMIDGINNDDNDNSNDNNTYNNNYNGNNEKNDYDCEMKNKEEKNESNVIIKVYKDEETHKFEKKYQTIENLKIEHIFNIFLVTKNLWEKMSKKAKTEFSNKFGDFFIKFNDLDYVPYDMCVTEANLINDNKYKSDDRERNLDLFLNKNKKYFYFFNLRIKLFIFLYQFDCKYENLSYKLQENLIKLKNDINFVQTDLQYLRNYNVEKNNENYYNNDKNSNINNIYEDKGNKNDITYNNCNNNNDNNNNNNNNNNADKMLLSFFLISNDTYTFLMKVFLEMKFT